MYLVVEWVNVLVLIVLFLIYYEILEFILSFENLSM